MRRTGLLFILVHMIFLLLLNGCPQPDEGIPGPTPLPNYRGISSESVYTGPGDELFHIKTDEYVDLTHTLHIDSDIVDVYYIFTNIDPYNNHEHPVVSGSETPEEESFFATPQNDIPVMEPVAQFGKPEISEYNRDVSALLNKTPVPDNLFQSLTGPVRDVAQVTKINFLFDTYTPQISATCRAVVDDSAGLTGKILYIYVADDCWDDEIEPPPPPPPEGKSCYVTQSMVDQMAVMYLNTAGTDDDINDWLTTIFGEEWGPHANNNLIPDDNTITILLYDIDNDDIPSGSYTAGLFWSKDNFRKSIVPYSNERVMFYIDAVVYAIPEGETWEITDTYPSTQVSTLAHEGQHMIQFYQKAIKSGNGGRTADTWINEMCSMAAEDFLSNKINADGPRGVAYGDGTAGSPGNLNGRLPRFNYLNDYALTEWYGQLYNYSTVYAFGSFLARDYGGPALFQKIVQSEYTTYQAIENAVSALGFSADFGDLLKNWGTSILLSDNISPPSSEYQYNKGGFFDSTLNSITYNLGSINLYNYDFNEQVGPYIYTTSPVGAGRGHSSFLSASNRIYLVGRGLTGDITHTIRMVQEVRLTVVVKDEN